MKRAVLCLVGLLLFTLFESAIAEEPLRDIVFTDEIQQIESDLSVVRFAGDDLFAAFLAQGGASSDAQVAGFLTKSLLTGSNEIRLEGQFFGCSTLSSANAEGQRLFGRNFDWNTCDALIVLSAPDEGYASVSTVNNGFVSAAGVPLALLPGHLQALIGLYAPLDGMNAKGLSVSVNMIQDRDAIDQQTDKPDLTTTTVVRLLLNRAATVEEAILLLNNYDLHSSMGMMVHFALADRTGRSVVVEYIDNEMHVVETPVVTNFYLTEGKKYGVGTSQSHERYDVLIKLLESHDTLTMDEMRDALDSVSKDNFGGFDSTEWSIVMNQHSGEVRYYHRENYENGYVLQLPMEE